MDAIGGGVRRRFLLEEFSDLRPREALEGARSGSDRETLAASNRVGQLSALDGRRRVQPDRRDRTRKRACDLLDDRTSRIEAGKRRCCVLIQVHAAMLLRRTRYRGKTIEIQSAVRHARQHQIERLGPHQRRRECDRRIGVRQDAMPGSVSGKHLVEHERRLEQDPPPIASGSACWSRGLDKAPQRHRERERLDRDA